MRKSDRLKSGRIQIEDQMKEIDDSTNELVAERQVVNDKTRKLETCNENLRRHIKKIERMAQPIGKSESVLYI